MLVSRETGNFTTRKQKTLQLHSYLPLKLSKEHTMQYPYI